VDLRPLSSVDAALKVAHRLWANEGLPGQTARILPRPKDFAALTSLVPPEAVAESVACGPDPDKHAAQVRTYVDADIDEVYVQQVGPDTGGFFAAWGGTSCRCCEADAQSKSIPVVCFSHFAISAARASAT
jgi:hypothetical protein